jgi:putative flippase GtrA
MIARKPSGTLGKLIRFGLIGIVNLLIDLAVFLLLLWLGMPPLAANLLSWFTAVVFSYFANAAATFERHEAISGMKSMLRFIASGAIITLGISTAALWLLTGIIGVFPAKMVGLIVAGALNFIAGRWSIEGKIRDRTSQEAKQ